MKMIIFGVLIMKTLNEHPKELQHADRRKPPYEPPSKTSSATG